MKLNIFFHFILLTSLSGTESKKIGIPSWTRKDLEEFYIKLDQEQKKLLAIIIKNFDIANKQDSLKENNEILEEAAEEIQSLPNFYNMKFVWISLGSVFLSEIGDKTFFLCAILGMRHPKWIIVTANMLAMTLMTLISAFLGHLVPNLIHTQIVAIIAGVVLIIFGILMINERGSDKIKAEYEEAKEELDEDNLDSGESKLHPSGRSKFLIICGIPPILIQSFTMIFLAEWGDRSQLSTIALGASGGLFPVVLGSILGHALCTILAIAFGNAVAQRISAKTSNQN
eukprot:NODE_17_length_48642_cov_1.199349.p20 type:complete len:285 gc:universal NODE_17_length_48642_cov_1.199349:16395-15541(-)